MYKKRILALDVGEKRIGVAVSDPMGWTAQSLESYTRQSDEKDIQRILSIAKNYEPLTLLIGMPRNMNGTYGPQADKIREFSDMLDQAFKGQLEFDIEFFDERLTTAAAERVLIAADVSRKKRRKVIDKMAAAVILQGYLDSHQS